MSYVQSKMECVAHYAYSDRNYSELKGLSSNQYDRLVQANKIRLESSLDNRHTQQCTTVPDNGFDVTKHGVHLEPCYKKFTAIISSLKRKLSQPHPESTRGKRTKLDEAARFSQKYVFSVSKRGKHLTREPIFHTKSLLLMRNRKSRRRHY